MRFAKQILEALAVSVVLAVLPLALRADEISDDLNTDRIHLLNVQADKINAAFQLVCAKYQLRYVGPTRFVATWAKSYPERKDTIAMFLIGPTTALSLDKVGFTFRDEDNQITEFGNYNDDGAPELKAIYDAIQPPKWSKDYATEVGSAFQAVLPIPKGVFLSTPEVEFRQDNQDGYKHGVGHWWFTWWRMDSHGNFLYDHIAFQMAEGFMPSGGAVILSTPFHEIKSAPLSEADALSRIKIHGGTLKNSALCGKIPFQGLFAGKEIRLIWEFWFDPPAPPPAPWYVTAWNYSRYSSWMSKVLGPPPLEVRTSFPFSIWIDAHTGELVGGDSEM